MLPNTEIKTSKTDRVVRLILELLNKEENYLSSQEVLVVLGNPSRAQGYRILKELQSDNDIRPALLEKTKNGFTFSRSLKELISSKQSENRIWSKNE
jgi:hypothetical protein